MRTKNGCAVNSVGQMFHEFMEENKGKSLSELRRRFALDIYSEKNLHSPKDSLP